MLARVIAGTVLVALNVSFAAALRRWGVGIAGPMTPWSWDTYDTPLPPALLLAGSVALSAVLWREVTRPPSAAGLQPVESSPQG